MGKREGGRGQEEEGKQEGGGRGEKERERDWGDVPMLGHNTLYI